jgi:hypothetical protein
MLGVCVRFSAAFGRDVVLAYTAPSLFPGSCLHRVLLVMLCASAASGQLKRHCWLRCLLSFGTRGRKNRDAPPLARSDFGDRILSPESSPKSGTDCPAPHCWVQGSRFKMWAGIWAQNRVLKIAPPGGPAR